MTATKNAHDWFCEAHGTYGWRGESCRQCPEAPSEIAELRSANAELKRQLGEYAAEESDMRAAGFENAQDLFTSYVGIKQQLAESQAREARLREALAYKHDAVQSLMTWCIKNINKWDFPQYDHLDYANAKMAEALALPHDDTALKEYRDAVIEECAVIAGNSCLVPPDGGSPTEEEAAVSEEAARRIRKLQSK